MFTKYSYVRFLMDNSTLIHRYTFVPWCIPKHFTVHTKSNWRVS